MKRVWVRPLPFRGSFPTARRRLSAVWSLSHWRSGQVPGTQVGPVCAFPKGWNMESTSANLQPDRMAECQIASTYCRYFWQALGSIKQATQRIAFWEEINSGRLRIVARQHWPPRPSYNSTGRLDPSNTRLSSLTNSRSACIARTHLTHQENGATKAQEVDLPYLAPQFPIAQ